MNVDTALHSIQSNNERNARLKGEMEVKSVLNGFPPSPQNSLIQTLHGESLSTHTLMGTCARQNWPEKEIDPGCGCMFMSNCTEPSTAAGDWNFVCPQESVIVQARDPWGTWPWVKKTLLPRKSFSQRTAEDMGMRHYRKNPGGKPEYPPERHDVCGFPSEIGGCRVPNCR